MRGLSLGALCVLVIVAGPRPALAESSCELVGATPFDRPRLTADGSKIVYATNAPLVEEDVNRTLDVYLEDLTTGSVELVSAGSDRRSTAASISADGRFVAFESDATGLHPGNDEAGVSDVFVRDMDSGVLELVSVRPDGRSGSMQSGRPSLSPDGSLIAFQSMAPDLVEGDTNDLWDVFVRDRTSGTTRLVSLGPDGSQATVGFGSQAPSVSATGRVAFHSTGAWVPVGDDLRSFLKDGVAYDRNIYVHDLADGRTMHVSAGLGGEPHDGLSMSPDISTDGRFVAFSSSASNLVEDDTNNPPGLKGLYQSDVFVYDIASGTTRLASVADDGSQASGLGSSGVSITGDGSAVAFESDAPNLDSDDVNDALDVFVHRPGSTTRVSQDGGDPGSAGALSFGSVSPSLSADGHRVAFVSSAPGLMGAGATAESAPHVFGVFVKDVRTGEMTGPLGTGCRDSSDFTPVAARSVGGGLWWVPAILLAPLLVRRPRRELLVMLAVVASMATALPAGAHHYAPIQPGAPLLRETSIGTASLNFVFRDRVTGELYIGTSAHAVRDVGVGGRIANDAAGEFGTIVYAREGLLEFSRQDYALIKIDADRYPMTDPAVRHWGGPSAVAEADELIPGLPTYQYGQASYMRHTETTRLKPGVFSRFLPDRWGYVGWASETRHGFGGDSGSPILYGPEGRAMGITTLFAAVLFSEPAVQMGPTIDLVMQELRSAGFDLELVTAPFHPAGNVTGTVDHCIAEPVEADADNSGCARPTTSG